MSGSQDREDAEPEKEEAEVQYHKGFPLEPGETLEDFEAEVERLRQKEAEKAAATKTNKAYTAAQFALLTSISGLPRTFASATTGYLIESMGYTAFFLLCTALAVPGMLLLLKVAPWNPSQQQQATE